VEKAALLNKLPDAEKQIIRNRIEY
jgi:hypothetical protein